MVQKYMKRKGTQGVKDIFMTGERWRRWNLTFLEDTPDFALPSF
jgi:hypothetical protein